MAIVRRCASLLALVGAAFLAASHSSAETNTRIPPYDQRAVSACTRAYVECIRPCYGVAESSWQTVCFTQCQRRYDACKRRAARPPI